MFVHARTVSRSREIIINNQKPVTNTVSDSVSHSFLRKISDISMLEQFLYVMVYVSYQRHVNPSIRGAGRSYHATTRCTAMVPIHQYIAMHAHEMHTRNLSVTGFNMGTVTHPSWYHAWESTALLVDLAHQTTAVF